MVCACAVVLAAFVRVGTSEIRHYTADELAELTCEALGQRHDDVIMAYHDAEIAYKRRTGAFHDDLGLPPEHVVPYAVLMKQFMRDNNISGADVVTRSSATPLLDSVFYSEISGECANNPSLQAKEAMREAATHLGLLDGRAMP